MLSSSFLLLFFPQRRLLTLSLCQCAQHGVSVGSNLILKKTEREQKEQREGTEERFRRIM